jgi:MATE family multidrug resistance protein
MTLSLPHTTPAPSSLGSATSTRVANSLGAGNAEGARLVFRVSALLTLCIGGAAACLTYLLRRPLVSLFTEEPAVVALAARALPFMALSLLGAPWGRAARGPGAVTGPSTTRVPPAGTLCRPGAWLPDIAPTCL